MHSSLKWLHTQGTLTETLPQPTLIMGDMWKYAQDTEGATVFCDMANLTCVEAGTVHRHRPIGPVKFR